MCIIDESRSTLLSLAATDYAVVAASPRASALISRDSDSSSLNIGIPATSVSD
jgi:hypothetical protein